MGCGVADCGELLLLPLPPPLRRDGLEGGDATEAEEVVADCDEDAVTGLDATVAKVRIEGEPSDYEEREPLALVAVEGGVRDA